MVRVGIFHLTSKRQPEFGIFQKIWRLSQYVSFCGIIWVKLRRLDLQFVYKSSCLPTMQLWNELLEIYVTISLVQKMWSLLMPTHIFILKGIMFFHVIQFYNCWDEIFLWNMFEAFKSIAYLKSEAFSCPVYESSNDLKIFNN